MLVIKTEAKVFQKTFLQDGMLVKLLKMIQSELYFNYSLVPSPDGSHGTLLNEENNWSGQIGLLQRKELDLSIMELTFTHERAQVYIFLGVHTMHRK